MLAILCLALCGFFSPHYRPPKLPVDALPVPLVRQATSYSCGAAALSAVLQYWGKFEGGESELYADLKTTPDEGTDPREIVRVVRELGLKSEWRERVTYGELRAALARKEPVILDIQAWGEEATPWEEMWEAGHYVVLVGMDRLYAYFMDPSTAASYGVIPLDELQARWHDYETTGGVLWRNHQLAIFIRGEKPMKTFPAPLQMIQ